MNRCCVAGCSNTSKDGFSLFKFPIETDRRSKWTKQIQRTRDKWSGPTPHSHVCSAHSSPDSFDEGYKLKAEFGIKTQVKLLLKEDAVPTSFTRQMEKVGEKGETASAVRDPPSHRLAFQKRERKRVNIIIIMNLLF